jgi:hypothetical protein
VFQGLTPTRGRHALSRPGQHLKIQVTGIALMTMPARQLFAREPRAGVITESDAEPGRRAGSPTMHPWPVHGWVVILRANRPFRCGSLALWICFHATGSLRLVPSDWCSGPGAEDRIAAVAAVIPAIFSG